MQKMAASIVFPGQPHGTVVFVAGVFPRPWLKIPGFGSPSALFAANTGEVFVSTNFSGTQGTVKRTGCGREMLGTFSTTRMPAEDL